MIQDRDIDYIRKRLVLTPFDMQSIRFLVTDLFAADTDTVPVAEISTLGFNGLTMATGNQVGGHYPCPYDLDPKHPVGFSVEWTADVSATGALVTWTLLFNSIKRGAVFATATGVLDTVIGAQTYRDSLGTSPNTDFLKQLTSRGIKNNIGLTRAEIEDGAHLVFRISPSAFTGITTMRYLSLVMDYVPMITQGIGKEIDAPLRSSGL